MSLWDSITVALEGLLANKLRSILTMLGVIIGVGAVITMLALAQGARTSMMNNIQQMGTNVLRVMSGQSRRGPVAQGFGSNQRLTLEDSQAIVDKCPSVQLVAPEVSSNAQVKYRNTNTNTSITGVTPEYLPVRNYAMAAGKFFTIGDVRAMRKVAVIGQTTATNLFGTVSPVGKSITIKGIRFQVIGKLAVKGSGGFGDADDIIFIPISTAMRRVFGIEYVRMISVQARSMALMDQASSEITALLRKRHRIADGADSDFNIMNQADIMQMANQAADIFSLLLGGIAFVSLLVGGIGIMNIMLVSVTERTREIGIRKALGAHGWDIIWQFTIEAVVLSLLGGIIGILFGVGGSMLLANLMKMQTVVTVSSVALSFICAAMVGIFFGFYPAFIASRLDPIEALRYE